MDFFKKMFVSMRCSLAVCPPACLEWQTVFVFGIRTTSTTTTGNVRAYRIFSSDQSFAMCYVCDEHRRSIRKLASTIWTIQIGNRILFGQLNFQSNRYFSVQSQNNTKCYHYYWFWILICWTCYTESLSLSISLCLSCLVTFFSFSINQNKWKCAHWISSERDLCFNEFNVYQLQIACKRVYSSVAICKCACYTN